MSMSPSPELDAQLDGNWTSSESQPDDTHQPSPPISDLSQLLLQAIDQVPGTCGSRLEAFLNARTVGESLNEWCGTRNHDSIRSISESLNRAIATVDALINDQLDEILHHPRFQMLESSWRGLEYLVRTAAELGEIAEAELLADDDHSHVPDMRIRMLNASLKDVDRDFQRAIEFDQSHLFRQIYTQEFGMPGGTPFGMVVADYEFQPWPSDEFPHDGLNVISALAAVGAASFCPIVTGASAKFFELDSFDTLSRANLENVFDPNRNPQYIKWRSFRESEDARFLALTVPRVLFRTPYQPGVDRLDGFDFSEETAGPDRRRYLWGNAAYAFGEVALRAFAETGWLASISGVTQGQLGGGLVTGLPSHAFATDSRGVGVESSVEVVIPDDLERRIAEAGFLPICQCHDSELSAFYNSQSAQKPREYEGDVVATLNAKMSSMMQYMLCVSQFARYLKVIARDKVGTFATAEDCEIYLQDWVASYVTKDASASPEARAKFPLYAAKVSVFAKAAEPGVFQCDIALQPHYELYDLSASVRMQTELRSPVS